MSATEYEPVESRIAMTVSKQLLCGVFLVSLAALLIAADATRAQSTPAAPTKKTTAPKKPAAPAQTQPVLEPKAIEILKAASNRLAAAHSMSFTATVTYESPSRVGVPLAYMTKSDVVLQRPDKLRVVSLGDGPPFEFYYDGKQMMAYAPAEDLVAIADAPPTIDQAMESAYHLAAIYFPFDDVIVADPYKDISQDLRMAFYIGQSKVVGGVTTDMVAYDSGGVFVEAWIGAEDKLPYMMRAVFGDDPKHLRHLLEISDWKIDPAIPADVFGSTKATGAKRIQFARPDAPLAPPAKAKPKAATKTPTSPNN
jgi:hypothetical protein